jgi:NTE family protein
LNLYEKTYIVDGFSDLVYHYAKASRCKSFNEELNKYYEKNRKLYRNEKLFGRNRVKIIFPKYKMNKKDNKMKKSFILCGILVSLFSLTMTTIGAPEYIYKTPVPMQNNIRVTNPDTLIMSGGGAKGVAYTGVLKYLEEQNKLDNIKNYAGASAGAIFSLIFYLGYNYEETQEVLNDLKWSDLIDANVPLLEIMNNPEMLKRPLIAISMLSSIAFDFGLVKGKEIDKLLRELIYKKGYTNSPKGKISFKELKEKIKEKTDRDIDLYIVACSMNYRSTAILSAETAPNMDVVDAIHASMSIPIVFVPFEHNGDYLVDGGTTYNYPIEYFDRLGKETLGFLLDPKDDYFNPEHHDNDNIIQHFGNLLDLLINNVSPRIMNNEYRTVFIDSGLDTLSFDMTKEQEQEAVQRGYDATREYFELI